MTNVEILEDLKKNASKEIQIILEFYEFGQKRIKELEEKRRECFNDLKKVEYLKALYGLNEADKLLDQLCKIAEKWGIDLKGLYEV